MRRSLTRMLPMFVSGIVVITTLIVLTASHLRGQTVESQRNPLPSFEVASIKPLDIAKMRGGHEGHQLDRERFVDRTEPLQFIVRAYLGGTSCVMTATPAFGFRCPLIAGPVPDWLKTTRFEIEAKMSANSVPTYTPRQLRFEDTPELNVMLRTLLEDRFHLRVHWVTKELPVYVLVAGKNGPKLKKSVPGSEIAKAADGSSIEIHGARGVSSAPAADGRLRTKVEFRASSMQDAAMTFSFYFDRQVLDRTGLHGDYDFTIEFEDDPSTRTSANIFSGLTPSELSTALQPAGLKLESTKASLQVLVIDQVEKPTEN